MKWWQFGWHKMPRQYVKSERRSEPRMSLWKRQNAFLSGMSKGSEKDWSFFEGAVKSWPRQIKNFSKEFFLWLTDDLSSHLEFTRKCFRNALWQLWSELYFDEKVSSNLDTLSKSVHFCSLKARICHKRELKITLSLSSLGRLFSSKSNHSKVPFLQFPKPRVCKTHSYEHFDSCLILLQ